jgi:hypothetical protein
VQGHPYRQWQSEAEAEQAAHPEEPQLQVQREQPLLVLA